MKANLLVLDDEPMILKVLARFLEAPERTLHLAASADEARRIAEEVRIDVAIVDKNLGAESGLDVARALKERDPELEFIVLTGYASLQSAIDAVQLRAYDYLTKPIEDFEAFRLRVRNAIDKVLLARERRFIDQHLRRSQKMEALGRLAEGVAHELGNVFAVVLGCSETLVRAVPGNADAQDVLTAAERGATLLRQLHTISRKGTAAPTIVRLDASVRELQPLLARAAGDRVRVDAALERTWPVLVDSSHVVQLLVNLATNARDAMPEGGTLRVRTANAVLDGVRAASAGVTPGEYAELTLSDTGAGIPDELLGRIFEPFFSTRTNGAGLGLAVSYGIVQQARGGIVVESSGGGTSFRIYFPRMTESQLEIAG